MSFHSPFTGGIANKDFSFNAYGKKPETPNENMTYEYHEMHCIDGYDPEGYDSAGFSAFVNNEFVGRGEGDDRDGTTRDEYQDEISKYGYVL